MWELLRIRVFTIKSKMWELLQIRTFTDKSKNVGTLTN
ncbi:hypothetical protein LEP1GSC021_3204 [Leptospira noguchii str. 1993005606]|nr:hypothetical protein LEP1GSC021_3204 [Leptospira noguchii str. 1993005606]